ncbi:MAG: nucleotidyltransferase domain-containing protein [Nanoarchaeota archaeon]|nr:nucleotidyltransferase domain-containing protein [Nanoarchaeota archaeon]
MNPHEQKILNLFFYDIMGKFQIREIGRITGLDVKTVIKYLKKFTKERLILRRKKRGGFPYYEANRCFSAYHHKKSIAALEKVYESGIIERLEKELNPKVVVLYGSMRKGVYHPKSDIDIFVQAKYKLVGLYDIETRLGHKVHLLFEEDLKNLSKGILQNIYNGVVISGVLEL